MEFAIIVIGITTMLLSVASACFWAGFYVERLAWNKLIIEGKLPKPKEEPKRFSNPIIQGKYYDAGYQK